MNVEAPNNNAVGDMNRGDDKELSKQEEMETLVKASSPEGTLESLQQPYSTMVVGEADPRSKAAGDDGLVAPNTNEQFISIRKSRGVDLLGTEANGAEAAYRQKEDHQEPETTGAQADFRSPDHSRAILHHVVTNTSSE